MLISKILKNIEAACTYTVASSFCIVQRIYIVIYPLRSYNFLKVKIVKKFNIPHKSYGSLQGFNVYFPSQNFIKAFRNGIHEDCVSKNLFSMQNNKSLLTSTKFRRVTAISPFTAWKVSKYGVFSGPYFPVFGPEKTPYLDTFLAVLFLMYFQ